LVNIIEELDVLEKYAGEKLGFYQLLANEAKIDIRVLASRRYSSAGDISTLMGVQIPVIQASRF
jgi:hypothetical protein